MRVIHTDLVARLRRADPTAQQILEAQILEYTAAGAPMEHLRDAKTGPTGTRWDEADSLTGFLVLDSGELRIEGTVATVTQNDAGTAELTDLTRTTPILTALLEVGQSEAADRELDRIKIWLNPRRSASQRREVVRWRCELYRLVDGLDMEAAQVDDNPQTGVWFTRHSLAPPLDVAVTGDGEGYVTFDYTTKGRRPRPKAVPPVTKVPRIDITGLPNVFVASPTAGVIVPGRHYLVIAIYALTADGGAAGNVSWDYDSGAASVTSSGWVIRGRRWIESEKWWLGRWQDGGSAGGTPRLQIESGSYTEQTLTFATNPFDVGATPSGDLELVGLFSAPEGTAVTLKVRNDADSAYVAFTDGQLHSDVGIGKTQPRKMQAILTPNAAGTVSPTLRKLGLRAVTRKDLSKICEVRSYEEAFDPVELRTEIPVGRLVAVKNGVADFRSTIEDLLAQNYPRHILLRSYIGDPALPRSKWLHKTDFLLGDWEGFGSHVALKGLSPLVKLKDRLPPYSPGTSYAPDGDQSAGSWTTDAGGGSNLFQRIDEATADETDYIQSGTSPSNQVVVFTLPTPSDIAGRRLFVDCDYRKDVGAGEQIALTIRFYQGGTVVAELVKPDIGVDRVQSTMELTDAQVAQILTLSDIRIGFVANVTGGSGARRAIVTWARFRSGGRRQVVTYTNQTLKAAYDDVIDNRLGLERRYRGPGIESTAFTVSKQLTGLRGRTPTGRDVLAKTELEALAYLAGGILHESQGRIRFTEVFGSTAVVALFPAAEITVLNAGPGLDRRIPEFFVPYRWDADRQEFRDEAYWAHQPSIEKIGTDTIPPPRWLEEEIAKWIDSDALADAVGRRTIEAFATGEILLPFRSTYPYPELQIGDLVAVETRHFVARDPNLGRQLRGRLWALGIIQRGDFWGREFTIWVRGYADILAGGEAANRLGFARPEVLSVQPIVADSGTLSAVVRVKDAKSVKVKALTTGFPTAAQVRAEAAQAVSVDGTLVTATLLMLTTGQTGYIGVFTYENIDGTGVESDLMGQAQTPRPFAPTDSILDAAWLFRGTRLFINWEGASSVASVKVATSLSAYPAAGTGTVAEGQSGVFDAGTYVYSDTVFVTITPYTGAGGGGNQGPAHQMRLRLWLKDGGVEEGTGLLLNPGVKQGTLESDRMAPAVTDQMGPSGREDAILNGDIEAGFQHWGGNGSLSIETGADRYKGAKSLKQLTQASFEAFIDQSRYAADANNPVTDADKIKVRVFPGEKWRVRGAFKASTNSIHGRILIYKFNDNKQLVNSEQVIVFDTTTSAWSEKEAVWEVPAGTYYIALRVGCNSNIHNADGACWADELHFWRVKSEADIADAAVSDVKLGVSAKSLFSKSQQITKTTTSASEVSVATYALAAGLLAADGQAVRIRVFGTWPGLSAAGGVVVKFGATAVLNQALDTGGGRYSLEAEVVRLGASSQRAYALLEKSVGTQWVSERTSPGETLANSITLDFRLKSDGTQTVTIDSIQVEHVKA